MGFFRRRPRRLARRLRMRRWARRPPYAEEDLRRLRRAHVAMANGEFGEAAPVYEDLAERAQDRGLPRAAALFVQAGLARARSGEGEPGAELLLQGLRLARATGASARQAAIGARVLRELREAGLDQIADRVAAELGFSLQPTAPLQAPAQLPPKCPSCGATVRPGEVEWVEDELAMCAFCGSAITADG